MRPAEKCEEQILKTQNEIRLTVNRIKVIKINWYALLLIFYRSFRVMEFSMILDMDMDMNLNMERIVQILPNNIMK